MCIGERVVGEVEVYQSAHDVAKFGLVTVRAQSGFEVR